MPCKERLGELGLLRLEQRRLCGHLAAPSSTDYWGDGAQALHSGAGQEEERQRAQAEQKKLRLVTRRNCFSMKTGRQRQRFPNLSAWRFPRPDRIKT